MTKYHEYSDDIPPSEFYDRLRFCLLTDDLLVIIESHQGVRHDEYRCTQYIDRNSVVYRTDNELRHPVDKHEVKEYITQNSERFLFLDMLMKNSKMRVDKDGLIQVLNVPLQVSLVDKIMSFIKGDR